MFHVDPQHDPDVLSKMRQQELEACGRVPGQGWQTVCLCERQAAAEPQGKEVLAAQATGWQACSQPKAGGGPADASSAAVTPGKNQNKRYGPGLCGQAVSICHQGRVLKICHARIQGFIAETVDEKKPQ